MTVWSSLTALFCCGGKKETTDENYTNTKKFDQGKNITKLELTLDREALAPTIFVIIRNILTWSMPSIRFTM